MSTALIWPLLQKELRDALRHRWLWVVAAGFGLLGLALANLSESGGMLGFSRTLAGLINLTVLVVPVLGFTLGAQSIAGERERRTLAYLLTQPISRTDLLVGKFLGLAIALSTALALGFGLTGLALISGRLEPGLVAGLVALAVLLGLVSVSLGLLVSVLARRTAMATGIALVLWFGLVLVADLGLMGGTVAWRLRADMVFLLALANPLQVFKLAAVLLIRPSLDILGPAGQYGLTTFGVGLAPLLIGLLLAWMLGPLVIAGLIFRRRGEP